MPKCQHLLNRRYCAQDKLWGPTVPRRPAPCAIRPGSPEYCPEAECPWRESPIMAVPVSHISNAESYPSQLPSGTLRVKGLRQEMEVSDGV